jgi:hypothetical protein
MTDPENEPVSPEPPTPEYEPGRAPDEAPPLDPTPQPPGDGRPYDAASPHAGFQ